MKKNNLIFFFFIFGLYSCSQTHDWGVLESVWTQSSTFSPSRKIAQEQDNMECFKQRFTASALQSENLEMEKKYASLPKVQGEWNGIDLSSLKVSQAQFLMNFKESLGDLSSENSVDISNCEDVVCLINSYYQSTDGLEGEMIYWWYLKTGSLLGMTNKIFKQESDEPGVYQKIKHEFSNYLFTREELFGFWNLYHQRDHFIDQLYILKEIQRIPDSVKIENVSDNICGLAHYEGYILLRKTCMQFVPLDLYPSNFYTNVFHEFIHLLDFQSLVEHGEQYSRSKNWLSVNGWENNQESVNEDGEYQSLWMIKEGYPTLVSDYSYRSPMEHFAEMLSSYRFQPGLAKEKSSQDIYSLVKDEFYSTKEFFDEELLKRWFLKVQLNYKRELILGLDSCEQQIIDLKDPCYFARHSEFLKQWVIQLKKEKPQACDMKKIRLEGVTPVAQLLVDEANLLIQTKTNDSFELIDLAYRLRDNSSIAYKSFLLSKGLISYEAKIITEINQKMKNLEISEEDLLYVVREYLKIYDYEQVKSQVNKEYKTWAFKYVGELSQLAENLFLKCWNNKTHTSLKLRPLLNSADRYLTPLFYNCLNNELGLSLDDFIFEVTKKKKLNNEFDDFYIRRNFKIIILNQLEKRLAFNTGIELDRIKNYYKDSLSLIKTYLTNDKDNLDQSKPFLEQCPGYVMSRFKYSVHLHDPFEISEIITNGVCLELNADLQFRSMLGL